MIARANSFNHTIAPLSERLTTQIKSLLGFTIPGESLVIFFDGFSVFLRSGRSVGDTMLREATSGVNPELRRICAEIAPRILNGESLSSCLQPYKRRFPPIVLYVLEVGEASGGLADQAQRLADTFRETNNFERKFRYGVYDPRLLLLVLCLIQSINLMIQEVTSAQGNKSIGLMALSVAWGVLLTAVGLTTAYLTGRVVMSQVYQWQALRFFVDTVKLALPRIGVISRNLSAARWARSFAVLWAAGVNISSALEVSAGSALNARYERALLLAARQTRQGMSLSDSLARIELLPAHLLAVIKSSETAGSFDENLLVLATEMERDALCRAVIEMNKFVMFAQLTVIIAAVIIALLSTGIIHL